MRIRHFISGDRKISTAFGISEGAKRHLCPPPYPRKILERQMVGEGGAASRKIAENLGALDERYSAYGAVHVQRTRVKYIVLHGELLLYACRVPKYTHNVVVVYRTYKYLPSACNTQNTTVPT